MTEIAHDIATRFEAALNARDLDAFVDLFTEDYVSDQPAHPLRAFRGRSEVRRNWGRVFETLPDLRAERLRTAVDGDTLWIEWRWTGTREGRTPMDLRGVWILGLEDALVAWGRLYMEDVEETSGDIQDYVKRHTEES